MENLIGDFMSGMSGLLGNLVLGWTSISDGDVDEAANQFAGAVGGRTNWRTGGRSRRDNNNSQELPATQEDSFGFNIDITFAESPQVSHDNLNDTNRDVPAATEKRAREPEDVHQPAATKKRRVDPVAARMRSVLLVVISSLLRS